MTSPNQIGTLGIHLFHNQDQFIKRELFLRMGTKRSSQDVKLDNIIRDETSISHRNGYFVQK